MGFLYDYQYQALQSLNGSGNIVVSTSSGIVAPVISGVSLYLSGISVSGNVTTIGGPSLLSGFSQFNSGVMIHGGLGSGWTSAKFSSGDIILPNKAIGISISGVTSVFCSSLYTLPNTNYMAYVSHNASGMNFYISGKTISGFSVGFNVTGASASTIDWMIFR